jgi:hypothetical protein
VHEAAPLALWEGFYVIIGTTAGALIGLQFVVLTLISESGRIRGTGETLSAFGTPNVVHFCAALLVSAIMAAPWPGLGPTEIALELCGVAGLLYSFAVMRRARRQRDYRPVLEDWVWHITLPLLAYAALLLAGTRLSRVPGAAFVVGGVTLLLLFIGIHNAWDTVTYVMFDRARESQGQAAAAVDARRVSSNAAEAASDAAPAGPPPRQDPLAVRPEIHS